MKPPVFYASGIHLRPESSGDIEILDAFLLEVYQCLMFSSNPSCQYLELRPLQWNWRQFCLGGSRCFKEVFSKCSFGLVSWDWSLGQSCLCPSFACPMCYKIQAQGGSSSSVHLAGATNFFSWNVHLQVSWIIPYLKKLDGTSAVFQLPLCSCLCKTVWNADKLDCLH